MVTFRCWVLPRDFVTSEVQIVVEQSSWHSCLAGVLYAFRVLLIDSVTPRLTMIQGLVGAFISLLKFSVYSNLVVLTFS